MLGLVSVVRLLVVLLTGIRQHRYHQHPSSLTPRKHKRLDSSEMQNYQRDPEHKKCKTTDETPKRVREDYAPAHAGAFRRTSHPFVKHFVKPVKNTAHSNNDVTDQAVVGLALLGVVGSIAPGGTALLAGTRIPVGHDQHAGNSNAYREDFVDPELFFEQGYAERIGEESRAVIDGRQITRGCQIHGHVPRATGDGESYRDERGRFQHVAYRRFLSIAGRQIEILRFHHLSGAAEDVEVAPPESLPGLVPVFDSQNKKRHRPQ